MIKVFKLKEVLSFENMYNEYLQLFVKRKHNKDMKIDIIFDFSGLNEAERLGFRTYMDRIETKLLCEWKGISKYLKLITKSYEERIKFTYDFYTEKEYKKKNFKRRLEFGVEIFSCLLLGYVLFVIVPELAGF